MLTTILLICCAVCVGTVIACFASIKPHFEDTDEFIAAMNNPDENSYS